MEYIFHNLEDNAKELQHQQRKWEKMISNFQCNEVSKSQKAFSILGGLLFFQWLFWMAQRFAVLAWPMGGKLVLKQGRKEHSQLLHSTFSNALGYLVKEVWGMSGTQIRVSAQKRTALSLQWWQVFDFCSLLTGWIQSKPCTCPAVLSYGEY